MFIRPVWFHAWILRPVEHIVSSGAKFFKDAFYATFWVYGAKVEDARFLPLPSFLDSALASFGVQNPAATDARYQPMPSIKEALTMGFGVANDIIMNVTAPIDRALTTFNAYGANAVNIVFNYPKVYSWRDSTQVTLNAFGASSWLSMIKASVSSSMATSYLAYGANAISKLVSIQQDPDALSTAMSAFGSGSQNAKIESLASDSAQVGFSLFNPSTTTV